MTTRQRKGKNAEKNKNLEVKTEDNDHTSFYQICWVFIYMIVIFFIIAGGFLMYLMFQHDEFHSKEIAIIENLEKLERKFSADISKKIAVGFGSCQDIIVKSSDVFSEPPVFLPKHVSTIKTYDDLINVFAYFFQSGAAAERYISNNTLFDMIVEAAAKSSSARYEVGGNAAVMAVRFFKEGFRHILLSSQFSSSFVKYLPKAIIISGPEIKKDDIHLLLEYSTGEIWGNFKSPRANRFIIHSDYWNPLVSSLDVFSAQIAKFNPDLVVISGLQLMDNYPLKKDIREQKLRGIQSVMQSISQNSHIHFEMASFIEEDFILAVTDLIIPFADSLGTNEQELHNLYQILKHRKVSLLADAYPRIGAALDEMRSIFKLLRSNSKNDGNRKLTRLHVHSLAFHAMIIDNNSSWKNIKSALAKSVLTAYRHTCGSETINLKNVKFLMDDSFSSGLEKNYKTIRFDEKNPISCWQEDNFQICVAPVPVCQKVLQTGGGGDNISSAALILQI